MTITSSSGKSGIAPPANPNAPKASPTGAPSVQSMPPTNQVGARPNPVMRPAPPPDVNPQGPAATPRPAVVGATQDTIAQTHKVHFPGNPSQAAAPTPRTGPALGSVKPVKKTVPAVQLTSEALFQRLRFFENVYERHRAYIRDLRTRLQRTGTAPPDMPHVEPLNSAAGDVDPNLL